jgi:hypothetical protein
MVGCFGVSEWGIHEGAINHGTDRRRVIVELQRVVPWMQSAICYNNLVLRKF